MTIKNIRRTLNEGGITLGTMVFEFNTTGIARIAAHSGADFLIFDLEHTGWGLAGIRPSLAAARSTPVATLVRVPAGALPLIPAVLDLGAVGVMVAMVQNADEARQIVHAAKYPPEGGRGYGILYADGEDSDVATIVSRGNSETLVIIQVETAHAVDHVEEIASVWGVDVIWIGHYDLSISLGVPGDFEHPQYTSAVRRILKACTDNDRAAGILASDPSAARDLINQGFRCIAYGGDVDLYSKALNDGLHAIRTSTRTTS
jgi:2-keto-3-deoxy-L-rhamnonate aldolase RhmA